MKGRVIGGGAAAASVLALALGGPAEARNPHCAGGIQYVVQGMRDKDKGNLEDYKREMGKAVMQLETCTAEDPNDLEALGYLGWAYAEVESAGPAGRAFEQAIEKLNAKGDRKKADVVVNNRDSYWASAFNDGIAKINAAQAAYPDFSHAPENEADQTLKAEAEKRYQEAIVSLTRASLIRPNHAVTLRSLGSVHAFMGNNTEAEAIFRAGLRVAPGDSALDQSLRMVRASHAGQLIDQKKYAEAIAYYEDLVKAEPSNPDLWVGLAEAHFKRAGDLKGDEAKPEYKSAADGYARAGQIKSGDADLPFNSALSYQNAGEWALAEAQWRATLKLRPDDVDAISALGASLAEQKKFAEALQILHVGVLKNPRNKTLHRQLGAVYTKMNNNPKSTEELMVYLALQHGQPVADPAAHAKAAPAGSAEAKMLASLGVPEQIIPWEVGEQKIESWFYWGKNQAYHFQSGILNSRSDWSTLEYKPGPGPADKK